MFRHVPNALTGSRLVLAGVFFFMLAYYQYEGRGDPLWLNIATVIYLIAVFTDYLDGYLARKWNVEGVFGRVVDPFVDKVLVIGSFIFFAGTNFTMPADDAASGVRTVTGVFPWMVVVILGRELLVTSLRSASEQGGQNFGAVFSGKLKMTLQSVTILVILLYVNYLPWLTRQGYQRPAEIVRDLFIWATIVVTIVSGLIYVRRAVNLYRAPK